MPLRPGVPRFPVVGRGPARPSTPNAPIVDPHEIEGDAVNEMPEEYQSESGREINPEEMLIDETASSTKPGLIESRGLITLDQALVGRVVDAPYGGSRTEILTLRIATDDINQVYTVTLGQMANFQPPPASSSFLDFIDIGKYATAKNELGVSMYALIEWGAGGVQYKAMVDVDREQQVVLSGSFIRITAVNNLTGAGHAGPNPPRIGAWVSLLPASTKKPVRKTFTGINKDSGPALAPGTGTSIFIPPFAHSVKIYRNPALTSSMTVKFITGASAPIGDVDVPVGTDVPELVIPADTDVISIFNSGAVNIDYLTAVYLLDL